jgi:hypothetical protein
VITERTKALALRLFAAFPGRGVQEMHVLSAAEELGRYPDKLADEVVSRVRAEFCNPPSVAEIVEVASDIRREHPEPRLALVRSSEDLEELEMPEEVRRRIHELIERWAEENEAPTQDWEAVKAAVLAGPRLRDGCSARVGEPTIRKGGHVYCPGCGEDLCPDCRPQTRKGDAV